MFKVHSNCSSECYLCTTADQSTASNCTADLLDRLASCLKEMKCLLKDLKMAFKIIPGISELVDSLNLHLQRFAASSTWEIHARGDFNSENLSAYEGALAYLHDTLNSATNNLRKIPDPARKDLADRLQVEADCFKSHPAPGQIVILVQELLTVMASVAPPSHDDDGNSKRTVIFKTGWL
ncbi:hypothetical protein BJ508DRAFT_320771 [Ascobolus immersus RN42]|uniref:Uncharacterized protein n=1 Tax=Ascobolus immersus RN42 TaxID=1160509 RepID=A0A3N4ISR3_ASCIM|nr:hypothetical protein BJ508DRAFT_320771 [Ascobolus immersus RN42]